MPADERRAAIIEATLPLLLREGAQVTTRQIAEAAGIAEGTIFRVFPDKETLIAAVLETAVDPTPVEQALQAIDLTLPLERRLVLAVEILQRRVSTIWQLNDAVGLSRTAVPRTSQLKGIVPLFEDRTGLRLDPPAAAQALVALTFAGTYPALCPGEPRTPAEIVSLLLYGISAPDAAPAPTSEPQDT